jgi:hypothetical protein
MTLGCFKNSRSKVDKMAEWTRKGIRDTFYVARSYAAQWIYIGPSQSESKTQQIDVIEGLAYSPVSFPHIASSLSSTRSSSCYNRERERAEGAVHATRTVAAVLLRHSPDILNINDSTLTKFFLSLESERIRLGRYVRQAMKRRKTRRD